MKLYAYCLVEDLDEVDPHTRGLAGAAVRLMKSDDLGVIVSDSESETVRVTKENALEHAAVVRSVLDRTTPLPFRFGALLSEQQLKSYLSTHAPALKNQLARVRGCVEMNLKIMWQLPTTEAASSAARDPAAGPGTTFLKEKQRKLFGDEQRGQQIAELSTMLRDALGEGLIMEEQITLRPSQRSVLAAVAHLVKTPQIRQYRERVAETLTSRSDFRVMVSGPWPPYSFANIELEFNAPFGVS